jgi:hypothetical protein
MERGYWDKLDPVKTDDSLVLATSYIKKDSVLIAIASWNKNEVMVHIDIDAAKLGWPPGDTLIAPAVDNYQPYQRFTKNAAIAVEPGKGWLLVLHRTQRRRKQ